MVKREERAVGTRLGDQWILNFCFSRARIEGAKRFYGPNGIEGAIALAKREERDCVLTVLLAASAPRRDGDQGLLHGMDELLEPIHFCLKYLLISSSSLFLLRRGHQPRLHVYIDL